MANIKISSLPLKLSLNATDMLAIVDTQFGANNYISKRTTVGALAVYVQNSFGLDGGRFPSVTDNYLNEESYCRDAIRTEAGDPILEES